MFYKPTLCLTQNLCTLVFRSCFANSTKTCQEPTCSRPRSRFVNDGCKMLYGDLHAFMFSFFTWGGGVTLRFLLTSIHSVLQRTYGLSCFAHASPILCKLARNLRVLVGHVLQVTRTLCLRHPNVFMFVYVVQMRGGPQLLSYMRTWWVLYPGPTYPCVSFMLRRSYESLTGTYGILCHRSSP